MVEKAIDFEVPELRQATKYPCIALLYAIGSPLITICMILWRRRINFAYTARTICGMLLGGAIGMVDAVAWCSEGKEKMFVLNMHTQSIACRFPWRTIYHHNAAWQTVEFQMRLVSRSRLGSSPSL